MGANLYRLLGKKPSLDKNKENLNRPVSLSSEDKYLEAELLKEDSSFSIDGFLEGAKRAFKIIVASYKERNIESAENLLSPKVLKAFQEQINTQDKKIKSFQITDLKASIIDIEVVKKLAKIKVSFMSKQKNTFEKKSETYDVKDIWTFEKILGNNNPIWVLAEVSSE